MNYPESTHAVETQLCQFIITRMVCFIWHPSGQNAWKTSCVPEEIVLKLAFDVMCTDRQHVSLSIKEEVDLLMHLDKVAAMKSRNEYDVDRY